MQGRIAEDLVERGKEVPVAIALLALTVAADTKLPGHAINIFAKWARRSDEHGNIFTSTDPLEVAADLGLSRATVFRAYRALADGGYISWNRARGSERSQGVTGRVRIILPQDAVA
jgi:CRP-like cAMP-binding protein